MGLFAVVLSPESGGGKIASIVKVVWSVAVIVCAVERKAGKVRLLEVEGMRDAKAVQREGQVNLGKSESAFWFWFWLSVVELIRLGEWMNG